MENLILTLIAFFAAQALTTEFILLFTKQELTISFKIYSIFSFYTAAILGIIYITKIFVILIILNQLHAHYREKWDETWFKYVDSILCILLFAFELHTCFKIY